MKVVITGGNRGIGLQLASQLIESGNQVVVLCRNPSEELKQLDCSFVEGIDVRSTNLELAEKIPLDSIDLLINNAGILSGQSLHNMDFKAMQDQFEVNALGPLRITHALLDKMHPGSTIAMITSRMGSIADNSSGSSYGYRMSKAALNAATRSLALDLRAKGIAVALLHPGYVQTDMTGGSGNLRPEESAKMLLKRIDECSLENTGTFYHANGQELPW